MSLRNDVTSQVTVTCERVTVTSLSDKQMARANKLNFKKIFELTDVLVLLNVSVFGGSKLNNAKEFVCSHTRNVVIIF